MENILKYSNGEFVRDAYKLDKYLDDGQYPVPSYLVYVLVTMFNDWFGFYICGWFGHDWRDDDPGDPEVGPQPDVYCQRCRHQQEIHKIYS